MFRTLVLADNLITEIPISLFDVIGEELSVHVIWIGRSPFTIIQETPVLSPALKESCPNVNGMISGGTIYQFGCGEEGKRRKKLEICKGMFKYH